MIWSLTKRLFELTEQLATKEMEQDPQGFILRETITPSFIKDVVKNQTTKNSKGGH